MKIFVLRFCILLFGVLQVIIIGQQEKTKITIINKSDFEIKELSIASELSDTWQVIELKNEVFLPNDSLEIFIELGENCLWDLLATDANGNEFLINADFCKEKTFNLEIVKEEVEQDQEDENEQ